MEPRSKQNPTESSTYWYVRGGQINLQKGHTSAAAFQAHLKPNLRTGVSGGFPEYNNNSPFLFGLQEPPVYKGKIVLFGSFKSSSAAMKMVTQGRLFMPLGLSISGQ